MLKNRFKVFFLLVLGINQIVQAGEVICTLEDYILTGLEFSDCQKDTLKSFGAGPDDDANGKNPCHELRNVVNQCANIVQRCFTPRGWQRGKLVFLDLLALQFPKHNHCDIFSTRNDSVVPDKLPGERCSVLDEVALLTQMRQCNNEAQTQVVNRISHHKTVTSHVDNTTQSLIYYAYPELCRGLKNVSETCFKAKLKSCYGNQDAYFHYAYMIEELKRAGIMLSLHLLPHDNEINFNILQCPVFQETSPFSAANNHVVVLVLSIFTTFIVLSLLFGLGTFVTFKYRLIPRFQAYLQNEPYEDIVIAESNAHIGEMNQIEESYRDVRASAEEPLPSVQDLTRGKSSTMSMADLTREDESVQST